jgi:hypothetical protein
LEGLRLEAYYNLHWKELEGFNLQEALSLQRAKVDSEWEKHESLLLSNYLTKRQALTGVSSPDMSPKANDREDTRWHSPEKQKALINTAPVLSPKSNGKGDRNFTSGSGSFSFSFYSHVIVISQLSHLRIDRSIVRTKICPIPFIA